MLPFYRAKKELDEVADTFDYLTIALDGAKCSYRDGELVQLYSSIRELERKASLSLSLLRPDRPMGRDDRETNLRADHLLQETVKPAVRHIMAGTLEQSVLRDNMLAIFKGMLPEKQWQCTTVEFQRRVRLCEELRDCRPSTVMAWSAAFPVEEWPKMSSALFLALLERVERHVFVGKISDQICTILTGLGQEAPLNERATVLQAS